MKQSGYLKLLQAQKTREILANREEAATLALGVMMCTLADEYGFGYSRLCHLAKVTTQNIRDTYAGDTELHVEHIKQRLRQIGFRVDANGRIYGATDEDGNPVRERTEE